MNRILVTIILGVSLWKGKDADDGMHTIAENLVKKENSPWKKVAWKNDGSAECSFLPFFIEL